VKGLWDILERLIAKGVADIHGGVIDVFRRVGEGTRFIVRFPPA
jgi:signal transduction histidine kinase